MLQQTASAPTSGRYRLMERLGGGSTGEVYRAYDRLTGQYIALKRVSTSTKAPGWEETVDRRFAIAREFEMLASLRHPNIIGVLDYGFDLSDDKHPYFIMTLLEEPETLLEAARGQPTAVQVDLLLQLLQALAYVHRRGILHRDLKPGNVLVEKGVVKLLDFGLALSSDETPHAEVGGTLAYIAPEVLSGQAPSVVSDLYAVGVMAYEMFAGQHPFLMEDTTEFINNLLYTPVDTGLLLIDERLRPLLGGLLAKKAEERPPSALAAMAALCAATHIPLPQETVAIRESFLQAARFVGRERELAQLNAALESILQGGSGGIWLVTGESGVGKSRLLDEVRTRALVKGALVLRGDAYDGAGALDQVGRDIIRRLAVSASISPENASVLKQLVPDLGALMGSGTPLDIPDAPPLEREAARQRMYTAIANSFYTLEQPVLILVEDVHWARGISDILRLMQNVTRQRPVLIIAAYRDEEAPELAQQIPGAHFLRLERLPEAAIGELSRSMLGAIGQQPHVVDLLQRETEGNAFFLVEVVRALAEDAGRLDDIGTRTLPETVFAGGVRRIVERRLQRVPEARPLLERAAVAGRYLDMNLMQALAAHLGTAPYATLDDWLNDCANAAVLDLQDCCRWRFSHDKLREGLLETLRTPLPQLHAEVAAAFEAAYPEASEYAALLAEHWRAAGDSEKEGYYAAVAGHRALNLSFFGDGVDYFTRALERLDALLDNYERAGLLCRLAESYDGLSDYTHAVSLYRQSLTLARAAQNDDIIRAALTGLSSITLNQGRYTEAVQQLEECLGLYRASGDLQGQARVLNRLGIAYEYQGQIERGITFYEQALALYRQTGDQRGEGLMLGNLSDTYITLGQIELALQYAQAALALHRAINYRRNQIYDLLHLADAYAHIGQFALALEYFHQAQEINRSVNERLVACLLLNNLSLTYANMGKTGDALDSAGRALLLAVEIGTHFGEAYALRMLGAAYILLEDLTKAEENLVEAVRIADSIGHAFIAHSARLDLARLYLHAGLLERALKTIVRARQTLYPATNHLAAALHGITLARMGRMEAAQDAFYLAMAYAEAQLAQCAELYEARYAHGLALVGLALCAEVAEARAPFIQRALESFQAALAVSDADGVLEKMSDLLEELAPIDSGGLMAPVRGLLTWR